MKYEITIQQIIQVEAASLEHAKKLVLENPPKIGVCGAGTYDGMLVSYGVYAMHDVSIIRAVEKNKLMNP